MHQKKKKRAGPLSVKYSGQGTVEKQVPLLKIFRLYTTQHPAPQPPAAAAAAAPALPLLSINNASRLDKMDKFHSGGRQTHRRPGEGLEPEFYSVGHLITAVKLIS